MGAYAPLPWAPPDLAEEVLATVIRPALAELRRRGMPYSGLLYAGLSLTSRGLRVVEFNARFGDPETQVVLDRLATPLAGLLQAAAPATWPARRRRMAATGAAVTVVVAAEGYPAPPVAGDAIAGSRGRARPAPTSCRRVPRAGLVSCDRGRAGAQRGRHRTRPRDGPQRRVRGREIRIRGGWYRTDIAGAGGAASPGRPARGSEAGAAAPGPTRHSGTVRVTTLEFFFDLVFVFTLTQLTGPRGRRPSRRRSGVLLFGLLWWMYSGYAWLTNSRPPGRTGAAAAAPGYERVPGHRDRDPARLRERRSVWRAASAICWSSSCTPACTTGSTGNLAVLPANVAAAVIVMLAGLTCGRPRYALWVAALAVQLRSR